MNRLGTVPKPAARGPRVAQRWSHGSRSTSR